MVLASVAGLMPMIRAARQNDQLQSARLSRPGNAAFRERRHTLIQGSPMLSVFSNILEDRLRHEGFSASLFPL